MSAKIQSMTSDQAQKTLLEFYNLTPSSLWIGERKPSLLEIEAIADEIQEGSSSEIQPQLASLRSDDNEKKGEFAKALLQHFCEYPALEPFVENAVSKAIEPTMCEPLIIVGAIMAVFAFLTFDRTIKKQSIEHVNGNERTAIVSEESHICFDPNKAVEYAKVFTGSFKDLLGKSSVGGGK